MLGPQKSVYSALRAHLSLDQAYFISSGATTLWGNNSAVLLEEFLKTKDALAMIQD